MLILGRRVNESVRIGRDIRITVTDIQAGMVRLGIEAPRDHPIWRGEVIEMIEKENHRASYAAHLYASGEYVPQLPLSAFSRINRLRTVTVDRIKISPEGGEARQGSRKGKTKRALNGDQDD